jgi:hypothetical protein
MPVLPVDARNEVWGGEEPLLPQPSPRKTFPCFAGGPPAHKELSLQIPAPDLC